MQLEIKHQETYSRGNAILKALFGYFYILVPHYFVIFFFSIWSLIVHFVAFFAILINGKYPRNFFDFNIGLFRWILRVDTAYLGLYDSYPPFGVETRTEEVVFEVKYPEEWDKVQVVLIFLLGIFMVIPHLFILIFMSIAASLLSWIAWFPVAFTGNFPKDLHEFIVKFYRWNYRVALYISFMYPKYPPFNGLREEEQVLVS